ncbi:MAG: UDP-N-acetylmuramoyl-L-alanyl-D-glutamate--2,6-diaminopimelate ligase [Rubrobacteridae bacterium]|nr:UDP-N-acetylmuramoyl-L-alanyl-D-glutamate--2,6-diaminopimelate ligase [Rubrobacteridae bacterium]
MRLLKILSEFEHSKAYEMTEVELTGVTYDSRNVEPGNLFICVTGLKNDGHAYAKAAIDRGAVALIVERYIPEVDLPQIVVDDSRRSMAQIASAFYGHPTRKMKLIGITGTNGKTTTAYMTVKILQVAGHKTGLLGTIECRVGDCVMPAERTTPESADLQKMFAKMVDSGVTAAVMEVSSHAIDMTRVGSCEFDSLVFTNLSQDHLDYHGNMESYFSVKKRIFDDTADKSVSHIINIDDEYGRRLDLPGRMRTLKYSATQITDVSAAELKLRSDGSEFVLITPFGKVEVSLKLPGLYNIYNAMAAAGASLSVGVELDVVSQGLEQIERVPGRFERIDCGQSFDIIVDYAHSEVVGDRREAIRSAILRAQKGDFIVIAGKGHESGQEIAGIKTPFDDAQVIRELIKGFG